MGVIAAECVEALQLPMTRITRSTLLLNLCDWRFFISLYCRVSSNIATLDFHTATITTILEGKEQQQHRRQVNSIVMSTLADELLADFEGLDEAQEETAQTTAAATVHQDNAENKIVSVAASGKRHHDDGTAASKLIAKRARMDGDAGEMDVDDNGHGASSSESEGTGFGGFKSNNSNNKGKQAMSVKQMHADLTRVGRVGEVAMLWDSDVMRQTMEVIYLRVFVAWLSCSCLTKSNDLSFPSHIMNCHIFDSSILCQGHRPILIRGRRGAESRLCGISGRSSRVRDDRHGKWSCGGD